LLSTKGNHFSLHFLHAAPQLKCHVSFAELVDRKAKDKHQHKQVPAKDLKGYHVLDERPSKDVDVTMLLLHDPFEKDCTCHAFMRFHNQKALENFKRGQELHKELQAAVKKASPGKGFIANRKSGSNGEPVPTKELLQFIHRHGTLPRRGTGVLMIPDLKSHQWLCYWNKCNEVRRVVKKHSYSQPQVGGKILMPDQIIKDYDVVQEMIEVKCLAGMVLHQLNASKQLITKEQKVLQVHPICVAAQNKQLFLANSLPEPSNNEEPYEAKRLRVLQDVAAQNWFSFTCWANNNHVDVFDKGKDDCRKGVPALENKIVLWDTSITDQCGRGGFGPNKYAFALLDWPNHVSHRRRLVVEREGPNAPEIIRRTWFEAWAASHNVTRVTNPEVFPPPQNN